MGWWLPFLLTCKKAKQSDDYTNILKQQVGPNFIVSLAVGFPPHDIEWFFIYVPVARHTIFTTQDLYVHTELVCSGCQAYNVKPQLIVFQAVGRMVKDKPSAFSKMIEC